MSRVDERKLDVFIALSTGAVVAVSMLFVPLTLVEDARLVVLFIILPFCSLAALQITVKSVGKRFRKIAGILGIVIFMYWIDQFLTLLARNGILLAFDPIVTTGYYAIIYGLLVIVSLLALENVGYMKIGQGFAAVIIGLSMIPLYWSPVIILSTFFSVLPSTVNPVNALYSVVYAGAVSAFIILTYINLNRKTAVGWICLGLGVFLFIGSDMIGFWAEYVTFPWMELTEAILVVSAFFSLLSGFLWIAKYDYELFLVSDLQKQTSDLEVLVEQRTRELKQAERFATIGETAAMVGHDLRNPLQSLAGRIYLVKKNLDSSWENPDLKNSVNNHLSLMQDQIHYMNKIVLDLQDYSRILHPRYQKVNIEDLIRDIFIKEPVPQTVKLEIQFSNEFPLIDLDPIMFMRVLTNLSSNAFQVMPNGGTLSFRGHSLEDHVELFIEDTGPGVDPVFLPFLFKPLITNKSKGQGLGLAVCKRIIEAHNGTITIENIPDQGAQIRIQLPKEGTPLKTELFPVDS